MADKTTRRPCAIMLTAIPVEYQAVCSHFTKLQEVTQSQGSIYKCGIFTSERETWDVGIIQVRAGNSRTAMEAERAITYFKPELMFFVGVAGGLKDVALGDVVVATKVYGYESGKANRTFLPRPEVGETSYELEQRAQAEGLKHDWLLRLGSLVPDPAPRVFVAPITAGEKVVSSRRSAIYKFLSANYSDALAVEMEGHGFLQVAHANQKVLALIIRGISDLIDDKVEADAANTQELAARHASAFAFEVLAKFVREPDREQNFIDYNRTQREKKDKFVGKFEKPLDDSGVDMKLNRKTKVEDDHNTLNDTLDEERENVTFSPESESEYETTNLPKTKEDFTEWYYRLGDYEQYYVLTTAVLHGAPVREVVKHTDSLYRFVHDEVERHENLSWTRSYPQDQLETQRKENNRFSDPLLRTISARDLHKITYTEPRNIRGVERLYWQDADNYGLSTFGLNFLEFLCHEFNSKGELGQFFLNALQQWSNEPLGEVSRRATHSYGVVLWCYDAIALEKIAEKWALGYNPQRTAELLDGAYEIDRVKSIEKNIDVETSSMVLELLNKWVKGIHRSLGQDEDVLGIEKSKNQAKAKETGKKRESEGQALIGEVGKKKNENQAAEKEAVKEKVENRAAEKEANINGAENQDDEETPRGIYEPDNAIRLGRAVARTYALIGKRSPDIALKGLERLLKLSRSNSQIASQAISEAGVSTYVILIWSGHVRDVLEDLADSAEQLSRSRSRPLESKMRHEYRYQRKIYLDAILEAFFRVAKESLTDLQKIQNNRYSFSEPLPPQPIIPDPDGRDVLLAFLLCASEVLCQSYIAKLLGAAILERHSKLAFSLLRYWAEIALQIRESQVTDAEKMYEIFRQFIVYLGRTVEKWCHDFEQQKMLPPPAFETFKKRLKQWCIEGAFYSHPIGSLAQEVLQQLGD